jgi:hypothetical protein
VVVEEEETEKEKEEGSVWRVVWVRCWCWLQLLSASFTIRMIMRR